MLSSITSFGERGRRQRFGITATAFVVGSVVGGATLGVLAGGAGTLLPGRSPVVDAAIIAVLAATGAAIDAHLFGLRLPTIRRQVDENWLTAYRGWVYGAGFGAQLGFGLATIVTTAAIYVMVVIAVLTSSVIAGAAIGMTFGLVRGGSIVAGRRLRTPDDLRRFHRALAARAPLASRLGIGAQGAIACAAITVVVTAR